MDRPSQDLQRREIHFRGLVQGVGFRYTTLRTASQFAVTGYVQNLPDGRVRLVAEGEGVELDRFLAALRSVMGGYIDGEEEERGPARGEFRNFDIRF